MSSPPKLEIDHPAADETIAPGHYAFRISASEPLATADISVDRGPWQACRHACGLWWFDWTASGAGEHQVAARGVTLTGEPANGTLRRFSVAAKTRG